MAITMEKLIWYLESGENPFAGNPYVEALERLYQAIKALPKDVTARLAGEADASWQEFVDGDQSYLEDEDDRPSDQDDQLPLEDEDPAAQASDDQPQVEDEG